MLRMGLLPALAARWPATPRCLLSGGLALVLGAAGANAAGNCPPAPKVPSAEQIQTAQRDARDRGFLWRISKDGRTSYLFGTLHVGKLDWAFPGPALRDALANTDTLAVEVDLTDPALAHTMTSSTNAPGPALPAPIRQRLKRQLAAACLPDDALANLHPVMQAITLTVLAGRWEGLEAGYAQEIVLGVRARATSMPIVALESAQTQLDLLLPRRADRLQRVMAQTLDQLERDRVRPVLRRLAAVWADSQLAELEDYARWCECADTADDRAFLVQLNDERNPPMAERIDALHQSGHRVLVAVGSLHMTGDKGLPKLLAARGYRVERLTPAGP